MMFAVALIGGGGYVAVQRLSSRIFKTKVQTTEASLISSSDSTVELTSTGYVVPLISSNVGAKISGRITKVFVKQGQSVKKGDALFELDSVDQRSSLATAKARAAAAKARAENAKANLEEIALQVARQQQLVSQGAASTSSLVDLKSREKSIREAMRASEAEALAIQAEAQSMSLNLSHTMIVAPIDGMIITKPRQVGESVGFASAALTSEPLVEIADLSSLVVETDVPEGRMSRVRIGAPCEIVLDAFGDKKFRGEVLEIEPKVNRSKATLTVRVKFLDALQGVFPDMAARVSFLTKAVAVEQLNEKPKLVVSKDAVMDRGSSAYVFVVEEDKVRKASVELGQDVGGSIEVLSGIEAGAKVVVKPPRTLRDGNPVQEISE